MLTLALACGSAWLLIALQRNSTELADPTDFASDRYDRWEQTSRIPSGLVLADSLEGAMLTVFERQAQPELAVWHAQRLPAALPENWLSQSWRGGWLLGLPEALDGWEENPGQMASKWHPRTDGAIQLQQASEDYFESQFTPFQPHVVGTETTWLPPQAVMSPTPLPNAWLAAWDIAQSGGHGLVACHMARWGSPQGVPVDSSLLSVWNGTWSTWEWKSGEVLEIWGWADSTGFKSIESDGVYPDGWYRWEGGQKPASWSQFDRLLHQSEPSMLNWDAVDWTLERSRLGQVKSNHRVAWIVKGDQVQKRIATEQMAELVPANSSSPSDPLAWVRNHRLKQEMAIVWERPSVTATAKDREVWRMDLTGERAPQAWEVDLYRNGKYQVALANETAFHVIDILGREVKGYPISPSSGIAAAGVIDYDRNRNYRILIGTGDGQLLNYREEGSRTPGWDFSPQPGRVIVQVHHLRVGNRDYLYAGQEDGSIRLLKRSGADRFESPVKVPPDQTPCFRLSQSIASSTVLYTDEQGWVQERTFGANEAVGMSRMTRGVSVSVEDRDGDGIQEVIVQTADGEEVWNARNQRISP